MLLAGIEPAFLPSQGSVLSIERQERGSNIADFDYFLKLNFPTPVRVRFRIGQRVVTKTRDIPSLFLLKAHYALLQVGIVLDDYGHHRDRRH